MRKRLIEFVCTGNSGRSPVAEIIARDRLKILGAHNDYAVASSGTLVEASMKGGFPMPVMQKFIDQAKDRGDVYDEAELGELNQALENEDVETVERFYNGVIKKFVSEEHADREAVLPEFGLDPYDLKVISDQTIARPNTEVILAMDRGNAHKVKGIYQGITSNGEIGGIENIDGYHEPNVALTDREGPITIGSLRGFVTGELDTDIANAFGKGREAYRKTVEGIVWAVPKAIDKIVGA